MMSEINFLMNLNSDFKISLSIKFKHDEAIILKVIQISSFFMSQNPPPGIDRVKLERRKRQVLLSSILNFLEIYSMFFKLVINLILTPHIESLLIHEVLL